MAHETMTQPPSRLATTTPRQLLIWGLAASLMLVGSGMIRSVQSERYEDDKNYRADCPFPLKTIPTHFDGWEMLKGSDTVLDPMTTRITGSTDHIMRTYIDESTGVKLSALILYGPAEPVLPHTPQVCYPSSGWIPVGPQEDRSIKLSDNETAVFRSSVFAKSGGRSVVRQIVYHAFELDGPWTPTIGTKKFPRKSPGILKVQIFRNIIDGEKRDDDEPVEDFIKKLIPIMNQMAKSGATPAPTLATAASVAGS